MSEIYTALAFWREKISTLYLCGGKDSHFDYNDGNIVCLEGIVTMMIALHITR
jgi:hypothetical protein